MNKNIFKNQLPHNFKKEKIPYHHDYDRADFNMLFLDSDKKNHIRQFYHIPPQHDIGLFKRVLFPCLTSCKYNSFTCTQKYRDLRLKDHYFRFNFFNI